MLKTERGMENVKPAHARRETPEGEIEVKEEVGEVF
jgi:hypothetical protein